MDRKNQAMQALSILLQLGREAAGAPDLQSLSFLIVNDTQRLVRYDRAVLWRVDTRGKIHFETASGTSRLERNSPYVVWLRRVARFLVEARGITSEPGKAHSIREPDLPGSLGSDWQHWLAGSHPLYLPLVVRGGAVIAGCWLERPGEWTEVEKELLEHLMGQYARVFHILQLEASRSRVTLDALRQRLRERRVRYGLLLALVCFLFLPVRLSVLAKAEIAPMDPVIVTAPMDGVVHRFSVTPNQWVEKDALLFSLDDTRIRNQVEITQKVVRVAEADLRRSHRSGFAKREDLAQTGILEERLAEQQSKLSYHRELLARSRVHAELPGIAIFNDANDWLGRPVQTGEKVLSLADPEKVEVKLLLSVQDAIHLPENAEVLVFLDVDPLHPLEAVLYRQAYEAQAQPDSSVAFVLRARIEDMDAPPRIGLQGTAKIHGERVSLYYYLFRRPLVILRQTLGL
uniref:Biotin-lipoyl like n=1 Tax=Candidatus Kentrum sp. DK TaxID=2126562 RepID=A0A450SD78_9GAMM|nr:MAG: Biotin-lipoyl like [Candidatus Kentron sp. DK]